MPSEKRARQRRLRDERRAAEQQRAKRRRGYRRVVLAIIVAGAVVGLVALLSGNHPKKPASSASKTTTTVANTTLEATTANGTIPAVTASTPACPPASGAAKRLTSFKAYPALCVAKTGIYDATVQTDVGVFVIQMHAASSLLAVNNFVFLARYHFFDGIVFHRVIPGFVVQGGDPTGTGSGGPGYSWTGNTPTTACEKAGCYPPGSVAMANSTGPSSNSSQFFIVLPGGGSQFTGKPLYTLFGTVISGMSVVDKIGADGASSGVPKVLHKMEKVTITQVSQ